MEVILLENIKKLGKFGETTSVKSGYARNFLIPKKKALSATKQNLKLFDSQKLDYEQKMLERSSNQEAYRVKIESIELISLVAKASDEGRLYGSVSTKEIVANLKSQNISLNPNQIELPEKHIREIGEFEVKFYFSELEPVTKTLVVSAE